MLKRTKITTPHSALNTYSWILVCILLCCTKRLLFEMIETKLEAKRFGRKKEDARVKIVTISEAIHLCSVQIIIKLYTFKHTHTHTHTRAVTHKIIKLFIVSVFCSLCMLIPFPFSFIGSLSDVQGMKGLMLAGRWTMLYCDVLSMHTQLVKSFSQTHWHWSEFVGPKALSSPCTRRAAAYFKIQRKNARFQTEWHHLTCYDFYPTRK